MSSLKEMKKIIADWDNVYGRKLAMIKKMKDDE